MKKRFVVKKGRRIVTRTGNVVFHLARKISRELRHYCKRVEVVGSIRRGEKNPVDIDIVCIPKDRLVVEEFMRKKGKFVQGGEKKSRWIINDVKVELYYSNSEEWGAALLAYSSEFGAGIGLRIIAKKKGFKLNQHGLFDRKTRKRIAGKTEREIYSALGRPYKSPRNR